LPDEQTSETADAPAALEIGGVDIENIGLLEGARVEYDDVRRPEVLVDTIKDTENIFAIRNVGSIRPNAVAAFRLDQGIQLRFHCLRTETQTESNARLDIHALHDAIV
jgi:hypothetical protein